MPNKTDIIEALLFASDRPVPLKKLANIVELSESDTLAELAALREEKTHIGALQVLEVAGGWQVVTKPEFARHITKLRDEKRQKLSRAAFEVLAIVAYRQPATRADIESLRGVDCAGSLQFLLEKKLLAFAGRKEAPGRPWLYATTTQFLDHFGLRSVEDMPSLSELVELNDDAAQAQTRNLFSRGAMKEMSDAEMQDSSDESATASRVLAGDEETESALADAESEAAPLGTDAPDEARVLAGETIENHSARDDAGTPRVLADETESNAPKNDNRNAGSDAENNSASNAARTNPQNTDDESGAMRVENDAETSAAFSHNDDFNNDSNGEARDQKEGVP